MPWYFYAAAAPTLYSITNFVDKFLIEKKIKDPMAITALSGLVSGVLGILFGIFSGFKFIGLIQTVLLLLAGVLLVFYLLPYYKALKLEDTSRVVPLFQFIPVFTLILSTVFLKESLSLKQAFGLILVVIAGFILSAEKIEGKIFRPRRALWFMLLSGLMYGCVGILFRFVVRQSNYWTTLSYTYMGTGLGTILLLLLPKIRQSIKSQVQQIKSSLVLINVNNGIAIMADMSSAYAISLATVPLVSIIGGLQPLIVLILGLILSVWFPQIIKEDIRKMVVTHKLISILIIFSGLYLVYF